MVNFSVMFNDWLRKRREARYHRLFKAQEEVEYRLANLDLIPEHEADLRARRTRLLERKHKLRTKLFPA